MIDGNGSVTERSSYRALQNSPHFQDISCFFLFLFFHQNLVANCDRLFIFLTQKEQIKNNL